jgi:hypothetical protein
VDILISTLCVVKKAQSNKAIKLKSNIVPNMIDLKNPASIKINAPNKNSECFSL